METQPSESSESYREHSWNRARSNEELQNFISRRLAALVEIEE